MFGFSEDWLATRALFLLPVIAALTLHEFAHAWAAYQLGDATAARAGRLTLNPLEHIDPLGLIIPLIGIPFGWAKPVPVNPGAFSSRVSLGAGLALTAAAGPLANVLLALLTLVGMGVGLGVAPGLLDTPVWPHLEQFVLLNFMLALFNLLPLPPLDGSRIADALLPRSLRPAWESLSAVGPAGIVVVIVVPMLLGVNLFAWPIDQVRETVDAVVMLATGT